MTDKEKLCLQCFECCKQIYIPLAIRFLDTDTKAFYKARGFEIRFYEVQPYLIGKIVCPQLTPKGCKIYSKRPLHCRIYDGRKDLFYPEKCLWQKGE